jgi:2-phospho-L-lactate guanylyltransferase
MKATAIVPVKRFGTAKQRLLERVDRPQRAAIVRAMLEDVLAAVVAAESIERLIVVTGEGRAERIALERAKRAETPIEVLQEPVDHGHSEAATLGIIRALATDAECVALLPGDCPLLAPDELDRALTEIEPGRVGVIPDRHGTGTNGLLMSPPDAIAPAFGPGSRDRHLERARLRDLDASVAEVPSMALDLDTPDDLTALAATLAADPAEAPATSAVLADLGLAAENAASR